MILDIDLLLISLQIVNPAKMKEKIINHLQTQIQDLERFVEFMQIEQEGSKRKFILRLLYYNVLFLIGK